MEVGPSQCRQWHPEYEWSKTHATTSRDEPPIRGGTVQRYCRESGARSRAQGLLPNIGGRVGGHVGDVGRIGNEKSPISERFPVSSTSLRRELPSPQCGNGPRRHVSSSGE